MKRNRFGLSRSSWFHQLLFAIIAFGIASNSLQGQRVPGRAGEHTLTLTPSAPSSERSAMIVAPGHGNANWKVFYIDTRAFMSGGVLDIDIQIAPQSRTDASFILLPADVPIPTDGVNRDALVKSYDVRKGTSTRLEYRFQQGTVFALAADGNWFSPAGAPGMIQFRATVEGATPQTPSERHVPTLRLTPQNPAGGGKVMIAGPGYGHSNMQVVYIDTTAFSSGGMLDIEIHVAPDSKTDGSFGLLPTEVPVLIHGPNRTELARSVDIRKGTSTRLQYRFQVGQVYAFTADGNWFSPQGATGFVTFRASVHP